MDSYLVALGSAFWLGILTSVSPCPMATNIAAITYIGRRLERPRSVLLSGLLYTLGRLFAYVAVGVLIVASVRSIPEVALFLQKHLNKLLGPTMIVAGFFILGLLNFRLPGVRVGGRVTAQAQRMGAWGAGLLGLLFALSFCPVSAALFFGSLIPLAVDYQSIILMPTIYGVGTALPVVVFAVLLTLGIRWMGTVFDRILQWEIWARRLTAAAFILVGIYYTLIYIIGVQL